jgi:hypothetical protein
MKKRKIFGSGIAVLILILMLVSLVSGFGLSSSNWKGNPLSVPPGETGVSELTLQNMLSEFDETVRVELIEGSEIASVEEGDILVKAGTKDTVVPVVVRMPKDVIPGTTFGVKVSFTSVVSGEGGGVALGTGMFANFDVVTGEEIPPVPFFERTSTWLIIGAIILIIFIVWLKRRKK